MGRSWPGRWSAARREGSSLGARDEKHAGDDEGDADQFLRRERFAEQVPGRDRVQDVSDGKHRIGDRDLDARQAQDPDDEAHHVAGNSARDVRLERELHAHGDDVLRAELEMAHGVGTGLEEQLRRGVEQYSREDESPARRVHGFLTITRRGSLATMRTGTGCALRKPGRSIALNMANASRSDCQARAKAAASGRKSRGSQAIDAASSSLLPTMVTVRSR